jgi:anti-anti-sigma factor
VTSTSSRAGQLDEHLTQARAESSRIILDLAGVDFMDTSALAVIIGHWKKLEAAGGTLALAGARYQYTKALWITGLAQRLTLYDSAEQGIAAGRAGVGGLAEKAPDEGHAGPGEKAG